MPAVTACVICPVRPPRLALTDSRACGQCAAELDQLLVDVAGLLPMLRALLSESQQGGFRDDYRHGRSSYGPAPLRLDIVSLLDPRNSDSPGVVLARWGTTFGTPATPQGLRGALGRIVERDELPAFAKDLRALTAELKRVCGVIESRIVATCRRDIPIPSIGSATGGNVETRECGGPIVATLNGNVATCTACGDQWPRNRWGLLGRLQDTG